MYLKFKHYFLLFTFMGFFLGIGALSFQGFFDHYGDEMILAQKVSKSPEDSYFKGVTFYHQVNQKPQISMDAVELVVSEDFNSVLALQLKGLYYSEGKFEPMKFRAEKGLAYSKSDLLNLEKNVELEDEKYLMMADKLSIFERGKKIIGNGNVKTYTEMKNQNNIQSDVSKLTVNSEQMTYYAPKNFVEYAKNVQGTMKRLRNYEEGLEFKTQSLSMEGDKGLISLNGSVYVEKGKYQVWSNRGEIFLENYNKKLKYYALSDDVRLREEIPLNGKKIERKAFAEKLEGWMNEKKVILTGFPKVIQDKDIIKGNRIVLRENSESVEIDDANSSLILK